MAQVPAPPTPWRALITADPRLVKRLVGAARRTNTAMLTVIIACLVVGLGTFILAVATDVGVPYSAMFIPIALVGFVYPRIFWRHVVPVGTTIHSEFDGYRLLVDFGGLSNGIDLSLVTKVKHSCGIFVLVSAQGPRVEVPEELVPTQLAERWLTK